MTTALQPPWLTGNAPVPGTEPQQRWVKGMTSPNPAGRPKGIVDKRTKVTQALLDDAPAIARVVIDAALEGDMQAAGLVLARIAPTLRSQFERVAFQFDPMAPISQQVEQVLAACASGSVSVDVGKQIIDAIGTLANVRAVENLEQRIVILEAKEVRQ